MARRGPLVDACSRLAAIDPGWTVEFGPKEGGGWIAGADLTRPDEAPLRAVLGRIGDGMRTKNRKVIAAAFALRFGWSAAAGVGPYLVGECVPDLSLDNMSIRFDPSGFFERVSLHRPRATAIRGVVDPDPDIALVEGRADLLACLRDALFESARPVVNAMYAWSRFPARAIWGQLMSSWAAPFVLVLTRTRAVGAAEVVALTRALFDDPRPAFAMCPTFTATTSAGRPAIRERRATCCLYYRLPEGSYCPSCPLARVDESVRRARALKAAPRRPA
jgi:hypothetical protein